MKHVVTIVGCGRIGSAIGRLLEERGHRVAYWDADPARRTKGATIGELVGSCDALFVCVPSWSLAGVCRELAPYVGPEVSVFSLTKGLDGRTGATPYDMIARLLRTKRVAIIGGPMMAEELATAGFIDLGTYSDAAAATALDLFIDTPILVERNTDPRGTALAGVLKNIYACGYGAVRAIGWNANQLGWYVSHAAAEMASIVHELGGDGMTAYGTAGLGDFITTSLSPHSSNTRAGELIATGAVCSPQEGVTALPIIRRLLGRKKDRYPLLGAIHDLTRRRLKK